MEESVSLYIKKPSPLPENPASVLRGRNQSAPDPIDIYTPLALEFPENSTNAVAVLNKAIGSVFSLGNDAPAPTGIILTPDAIGSNPVTWYYKLWVEKYAGNPEVRSLFTEESSIIVGDDTTKIVITGYVHPWWATDYFILLGTSSGIYDHYKNNVYDGTNGDLLFEMPFLDLGINDPSSNPVKKIPTNPYHLPVAPINISITPNAIGDNPVTWYYKVIQINIFNKRTPISVEYSYTIGDSTTELIFNCNHTNYSTPDLFIIVKGTTSGIYTNIVFAEFTSFPDDFTPVADVQLPFDLLTGADEVLGETLCNLLILLIGSLYIENYDNDLFAIDPETGELTPLSPFDYEDPQDVNGDGVYDVLVRVMIGGNTAEFLVSITVTDVEEI